jgi:hypothetical protein
LLLELGRAISLVFSILSLYAVLDVAFFLPATRWEERLVASFARVGVAACVCLASGMLFRYNAAPQVSLARTLPVRLLLWTIFGVVLLFALAWYLDVYYIPLIWKNQPN